MASWAQQRKATYILGFFFVIILIASYFLFQFLNRPATCSDGIQNQGEQGIDCGGPCATLCRAQYVAPTVLWTTWSKVLSSGTYNILVYAQNPNLGAGAAAAPYYFKIYDNQNVLLYSATGTTYIPANNTFVIFQDGINLFDKTPARMEFGFTDAINWQRATNQEAGITTVSKQAINTDTQPKVLATIENTTLQPIANVQSVAILYDANDNAVAFSKTKTDVLPAGGSKDIVFTWPEPFSAPIQQIEIVSEVLPK